MNGLHRRILQSVLEIRDSEFSVYDPSYLFDFAQYDAATDSLLYLCYV